MLFLDLREPVSSWSHCVGLPLALPGTLILWRRSAGDSQKRRCLLVYGLSLAFCYAASALYHGLRLPGDRLSFFNCLDHIGIFVLIAGSYTPLAWSLLRGRWRWGTLAVVWLFTAVTAVLLAVSGPFPCALSTCLYLGMGWGVVVCYFEIARVVSDRRLSSP